MHFMKLGYKDKNLLFQNFQTTLKTIDLYINVCHSQFDNINMKHPAVLLSSFWLKNFNLKHYIRYLTKEEE